MAHEDGGYRDDSAGQERGRYWWEQPEGTRPWDQPQWGPLEGGMPGGFNPRAWAEGEQDLGSMWRMFESIHDRGPEAINLQGMAGQAYENNPFIQQMNEQLMGNNMRDMLVSQGRGELEAQSGQARQRTQEGLARQGLQNSGMGATISGLRSFQDAKVMADIRNNAEIQQMQAKQQWGTQQARDMADLWSRMASTFLAQENEGVVQPSPWAVAAGGIGGLAGGMLGSGGLAGLFGSSTPGPVQ